MEMGDLIGQFLGMYGLAIVISIVVAIVIKGIVAALSLTGRTAPPAAAQLVSKSAPGPAVDQAQDDIAAIAAAVYAVMGAHRIVRIQDARRSHAWEAEGRIVHQTSHAPRHR